MKNRWSGNKWKNIKVMHNHLVIILVLIKGGRNKYSREMCIKGVKIANVYFGALAAVEMAVQMPVAVIAAAWMSQSAEIRATLVK